MNRPERFGLARFDAVSRGRFAAVLLAFVLITPGCRPHREGVGEEEGPAVEGGELSRSAVLYFESDGGELAGERREIFPGNPSREAFARALLAALAGGSESSSRRAVVPPALETEGIFFDDMGGLFLDLKGASLRSWRWGSSSELAFVRAVVRTMGGSFPDVSRVTFLIDGERVESIAGHVGATRPFEVAEWR